MTYSIRSLLCMTALAAAGISVGVWYDDRASQLNKVIESLTSLGAEVEADDIARSYKVILCGDMHCADISRSLCLIAKGLPGVRALEVSGAGFGDVQASALPQLRELRELDINGAAVTDLSEQFIGKLSALESLTITRTGITDDCLGAVSSWPRLTRLDLSHTGVQGKCFTDWGQNKCLQTLLLDYCDISDACCADLGKITSLRTLSLQSARISDLALADIGHLINLEDLDLSNTDVCGPGLRQLAGLSRLKRLSVAHGDCLDTFQFDMQQAVGFDMQQPSPGSGVRLRYWDISLQQCPLIKSLEDLDMTGTHLDKSDIARLAKFPSLQTLDLNRSKISGGITDLGAIAALRTLSLQSTPLRDEDLSEIGRLAYLENLDLSQTGVRGPGLRHLAGLSRLRRLSLNRCDLASALGANTQDAHWRSRCGAAITLRDLPVLKSLDELNLVGVDLVGDDITRLALLPSLRTLDLAASNVSDSSIGALAGCHFLKVVFLDGTRVTDSGKAHLRSLHGPSIRSHFGVYDSIVP